MKTEKREQGKRIAILKGMSRKDKEEWFQPR